MDDMNYHFDKNEEVYTNETADTDRSDDATASDRD